MNSSSRIRIFAATVLGVMGIVAFLTTRSDPSLTEHDMQIFFGSSRLAGKCTLDCDIAQGTDWSYDCSGKADGTICQTCSLGGNSVTTPGKASTGCPPGPTGQKSGAAQDCGFAPLVGSAACMGGVCRCSTFSMIVKCGQPNAAVAQ